MNEELLNFEAFIEEYNDLPLSDKEKSLIAEIIELKSITDNLCSVFDIVPDNLINKSTLEVLNRKHSEEEFLTVLYAFLQEFKESLGAFLKRYAEDNYE